MKKPDSSSLSTDQRHLINGTLMGSLSRDMVLGSYMVAYAVQVQHFSNAQISLFMSIIPLFVIFRFWFLDLIRSQPRINVLHWARTIQGLCLVALLLCYGQQISLSLLIGIGVVFFFGNEFFQNAVWMNLVTEVSTPNNRGYFLGKIRQYKQGTYMLFSVIGAVIVGETLSHGEFSILLLIVLALLLNSAYWYRKVQPVSPPEYDKSRARGQLLTILRTHPMLKRPLLISFIDAVVGWGIFIVYLVGTLHLPTNILMLTISVSMLGSIGSEVFWGKRTDSHGVSDVFRLSYIGRIIILPAIFFIPDFSQIETGSQSYWIASVVLLAFFFIRGILDSGQMMASSIYRTQFLGKSAGFHAINLLTAITQLFGSALVAAGGFILVSFSGFKITNWGAIWYDPFRLLTIAIILAFSILALYITKGIAKNQDV